MEEEKAAAYYDELTRKGGGAARFKQGLGFSSAAATTDGNPNDAVPARGSALPSSSSFLSSFVKASTPSNSSEIQKHAQIKSIQNKLKKKPNSASSSRVSDDRDSRGREGDRHSSRRRRSRSRDDHERSRNRRRHRSSSRDRERDRDRGRNEDMDRYGDRERGRRKRSRSVSPRRHRRSEKSRDDDDRKVRKEKTVRIDHAKLIEGYDKMSPAERVRAKMKLQLSETAEQDGAKGMGSGWERFNFDKDAPLDDEEIQVAEDDGDLVKHIGQSFRFSAVEARREEKIKATHDEAIFGTSSLAPPVDTDSEAEADHQREIPETAPVTNLISDQVRTMQQGSWRDRARKS